MKLVIVASENPVKLNVAKRAFAAVWPKEEFSFTGVASVSGVPDQPYGEETRQGAINRLEFIKAKFPEADYWISQEGGLYREEGRLLTRAVIMVSDGSDYIGRSSTAGHFLPIEIEKILGEGFELGVATDRFFSSVNSKHSVGTIGFLTDGLISREDYYLQAAIIALSELRHRDWYQ
jgi:inosine/xanthosine triphosphatase